MEEKTDDHMPRGVPAASSHCQSVSNKNKATVGWKLMDWILAHTSVLCYSTGAGVSPVRVDVKLSSTIYGGNTQEAGGSLSSITASILIKFWDS